MLWVCFILIGFFVSLVKSDGLTVLNSIKCGEKTCKVSEYCSQFGYICSSCAEICTLRSSNFDQKRCEESCQIYIHDSRYVLQNGVTSSANTDDLKGQVDRLSRLVTVSMTLICLMLIILTVFLGFQLYRWKEKKNITFASFKQKIFRKRVAEDPNRANNIPDSSIRKGELKLEMPSNLSQSDHSPVTVTTSISRRPAEDSTLDYAYDNPALSPSR